MDRDRSSSVSDQSTLLESTYRQHFASLMRVAFLMTGSTATAEDAVHDVFVRCAPRLSDLDHPESYLRACVVNECRAQHRRASRTPDDLPSGDEQLDSEQIETLEALATLTDRQRAAVVLRYFADLPEAQIAEVLGCRPATVRSLVHRALGQLRKAMT